MFHKGKGTRDKGILKTQLFINDLLLVYPPWIRNDS